MPANGTERAEAATIFLFAFVVGHALEWGAAQNHTCEYIIPTTVWHASHFKCSFNLDAVFCALNRCAQPYSADFWPK